MIQSNGNIGKVLSIIVCFVLPLIFSQRRKMQLYEVSLSPSQFIPAEGFQRGETQVYVSGKGFNAYGKGMNLYFGPYECDIVPQISTINTVVCKTSPMQKGKKKSNFPLTVYMFNSLPATCQTRKCLFSYLNNQTFEEQQKTRILAQYTPVLKLTCTGPTQYDNGGAVCELCDGLQNSPGTAAANRKACNCNPTFVWNSTSNACECPKNFVLLGGSCLACAPLKNKYGTGFSAGLSSCECKNSDFVFNSDTFSCVCKESNTFINAAGLCVSCGDKNVNGTGSVNQTFRTCSCKESFVWSPTLSNCFCPPGAVYDNTTFDPLAKCLECSKLKGKNSSGVLLPNNSCQCSPSFVFDLQTFSCTCPDPNSFIDKTSGVCFSCSNIGNSTNTADIQAKVCKCKETYLWNPLKSKTACLCPDSSIILSNGSCFTCARLKGKNGTGSISKFNNTSCECMKSFVFNTDTNTCECPQEQSFIDKTGLCVACKNTPNGTGAANVTAKHCVCADNTYIWTPTLRVPACVCPINSILIEVNGGISCFKCDRLKGKNGTGMVNTTNPYLCACAKSFVFNNATQTCQCPDPNSYVDRALGCVSCTNIGNSSSTPNSKGCNCYNTYVWNPTVSLSACLCPANSIILQDLTCFSCSALKGKNGTGLVSKTQSQSCECAKNFIWSSFNKACLCPDAKSYIAASGNCVPCKGLGNTTGEINSTSNTCICLPGFYWTPSKTHASCLCPTNHYFLIEECISCIVVRNRNGTGLINKTDSKSCECRKSFVYNQETNSCTCPFEQSYIDPISKLCVSCVGVGNGTGKVNLQTKKCVCLDSSLVWTPTLKVPACVCQPNSIFVNGKCFSCSANRAKNLTGLVDMANSSLCACLKSFVFNTSTLGCQCPDPNSYIDKKTGLCIPCSNIKNGSIPAAADVVGRTCVCVDPSFVWVPSLKDPGCVCLPNSILIGGKCFSCTTLKGKNGMGIVNSANNSLCACYKSFTFNTQTKACECSLSESYIDKSTGLCLSCVGVGNSTETLNEDSSGCKCNDQFVWNPIRSTSACLCPPLAILNQGTCFLCTTIALKNATGKVSPSNPNACQCSRSYVFNPSTNTCQCPDPNSFVNTAKLCVACSNVQYSLGTVNDTGKACNCNDGFAYSTSLNKCICPSPKKIVNGNCVLQTLYSSGNCPNGMKWDSELQACACEEDYAKKDSKCVRCSTIPNSNGKSTADRASCSCEAGFRWITALFQCSEQG